VWIRNGAVLGEAPVPPDGALALDTVSRPGDWFTLVVRQRDDPTVWARAIFTGR